MSLEPAPPRPQQAPVFAQTEPHPRAGNNGIQQMAIRTGIALAGIGAIALTYLYSSGNLSTAGREPKPDTACMEKLFEGDRFVICLFDPSRQTLRLMLEDKTGRSYRSFANLRDALGSTADRVAFAMNAGMFDAEGKPVGLYVQDGEQRFPLNRGSGTGNFYMAPNGVFWLDQHGPHVTPTTSYHEMRPTGVAQATQSGPLLVINGKLHPGFERDGPSRNIRNGVGVTLDRRAIFAISQSEVSFGKFARLFRDSLDCPDALYLDGYVSTLWNPAAGRPKQLHPLGPMILVSNQ